jgi:Uncharacterized protein conserved in bacteria (DUF2188)
MPTPASAGILTTYRRPSLARVARVKPAGEAAKMILGMEQFWKRKGALDFRIPACDPSSRHAARNLVMPKIHYRVVQHDGGWAYTLNDVFSEPFRDKATALAAARRVAAEQRVPGNTTHIEFQDNAGVWHTELSEGDDRPDADVTS